MAMAVCPRMPVTPYIYFRLIGPPLGMGSWKVMRKVIERRHEAQLRSINGGHVELRRKVDVCVNWCCAFIDLKDPPPNPYDLRDIRQLSALTQCPVCKSDRFFPGTSTPREVS